MSSPRTILVTGGNGGLGLAMARSFLESEPTAQVWLGVRQGRERADALSATNPGRCRVVSLDVTNADLWANAITSITQITGRMDVLVNNAGMHEDSLLATMAVESWDRVLATNLDAVFLGCRAVLPTMITQRSGRIVNISSLSAWLAPAGQTNYAAAKAGVVALTQSLAKEVARIGITVNAVCPGYIESDALSGFSDDQRRAAAGQIPMRRLGKPEEVAAAVIFLASPAASYVTGAALKVDGGIL